MSSDILRSHPNIVRNVAADIEEEVGKANIYFASTRWITEKALADPESYAIQTKSTDPLTVLSLVITIATYIVTYLSYNNQIKSEENKKNLGDILLQIKETIEKEGRLTRDQQKHLLERIHARLISINTDE